MNKSDSKIVTFRSSGMFRQKKIYVMTVLVVTFLVLFLINAGSYFFIRQIDKHLESSLDARLVTVANFAADQLHYDIHDIFNVTDHADIQAFLNYLKTNYDLESAYIIDSTRYVLIDSDFNYDFSSNRNYLARDSLAIQSALNGMTTTSQLYSIADQKFKNVYTPLIDAQGNIIILVLEAGVDYFNIIQFFQRGLYIGSVISLALFVFLTIFLSLATRVFLHTEARLIQARRLAALGQMAATVAHEIRNPLGIIKSTSDVLREKYDKSGTKDELFGFIDDEINRLNRLVCDFLSFSREPVLNLAQYNLCQLVRNVINSVNLSHEENVNLSLDCEKEDIGAFCDADAVEQVLLNLTYNAVHAVKDIKGRVHIYIQRIKIKGKPFAQVRISDNGPGLKDGAAKIFEPFYTTKTTGSGLGLAVCRSIIEKHNGTISAENDPQGGAVFTFSIPQDER